MFEHDDGGAIGQALDDLGLPAVLIDPGHHPATGQMGALVQQGRQGKHGSRRRHPGGQGEDPGAITALAAGGQNGGIGGAGGCLDHFGDLLQAGDGQGVAQNIGFGGRGFQGQGQYRPAGMTGSLEGEEAILGAHIDEQVAGPQMGG